MESKSVVYFFLFFITLLVSPVCETVATASNETDLKSKISGQSGFSAVILTPPPFETASEPHSITLEWETSHAGYSVVRYQENPSFGEPGGNYQIETGEEERTKHYLEIESLSPASIYRLQTGAIFGPDTLWSEKQFVSTGSPISASQEMNVYFNGPVDVSVSDHTLGTHATLYAETDFADHYVYRIGQAGNSIDMTFYNLSQSTGAKVRDALLDAASRGVQIRLVMHGNLSAEANDNRNILQEHDNIQIIQSTSNGLMHNKFAIIDIHGGAPEDIWIITGSWNSTNKGNNNEYQNMIEFQDPALAGGYLAEFNQMFGSGVFIPNPDEARFGNQKTIVHPTRFWINEVPVEIYFSPQSATEQQILNLIENTETDLMLNLNLITRNVYADAMKALLGKGKTVRGAIGAPWYNYTLFERLQNFNVTYENAGIYDHNASDAPRFLHHKTALFNTLNPGSGTGKVLTGSMNWSAAGNFSNDENTILIFDDLIANFYYQEAKARYLEGKASYVEPEPGPGPDPDPCQGKKEIWNLPFDKENRVHDLGESLNFIEQLQPCGGDVRVRVGDGGNQIILSEEDNHAGSYSGLILEASSSTSLNIVEIGDIDARNTLYFSSNIHLSAYENSNFLYFWIGNAEPFRSSIQSLDDLFFGLRWDISPAGLVTHYRSDEGNWAGGNIGTLFETGHTYKLEVYINNDVHDHTYYRDGFSYELLSGYWDLWVDGEHIETARGQRAGTKAGDDIGLIRFYGGRLNGGDARLNLDNIRYSNSLPEYRTIAPGAGWNMLASPRYGARVKQLARQNLVQGFPESYDETKEPNLYLGYDQSTQSFIPASQLDEELLPGMGLLWYLWDNDKNTASRPHPFGLLVTGEPPSEMVTVPLQEGGWTLLGNPFSFDLDIFDIGNWVPEDEELVSYIAQIWDRNSGDHGSFTLSSNNDHRIAPWQGFFLESRNAGQITFPVTAKASSSVFYKKNREFATAQTPLFRSVGLTFSGIDDASGGLFSDYAVNLFFHPESGYDIDPWCAAKRRPLSDKYVVIGLLPPSGEMDPIKSFFKTDSKNKKQGSEEALFAQYSLPYDLKKKTILPMMIIADKSIEGTFSLQKSHIEDIPSDWEIFVRDNNLDQKYDLRKEEVPVNLAPDNKKRGALEPDVSTPSEFVLTPPLSGTLYTGIDHQKYIIMDHLELVIIPETEVQASPGQERPSRFQLFQNYPNPFNPETVIRYDVPIESHVKIKIFDVTGRLVDTLADRPHLPGSYKVFWDAVSYSSGIYLYRLEADDGKRLTGKMSLIK